jgi:hypothetical protein
MTPSLSVYAATTAQPALQQAADPRIACYARFCLIRLQLNSGGWVAGESESHVVLDSPERMTLLPFPLESRVRWRRLDVPGREEARASRTITGWRLTGDVEVEDAGVVARIRYAIECDPDWRTRSARVAGELGGAPIQFTFAADGAGRWTESGNPVPDLSGCLDLDRGFTPATNTLPIRRLDLAVGERAPVRSAWLRFPELRLEPLEQTYTREAEQRFRYGALVDGEPFIALLDVDAFGRVVRYEGLWGIEFATPDGTSVAAT